MFLFLFHQLKDLVAMIDNVQFKNEFLNVEIEKTFHEERIVKLRELALHKDFLSGKLYLVNLTFDIQILNLYF